MLNMHYNTANTKCHHSPHQQLECRLLRLSRPERDCPYKVQTLGTKLLALIWLPPWPSQQSPRPSATSCPEPLSPLPLAPSTASPLRPCAFLQPLSAALPWPEFHCRSGSCRNTDPVCFL